MTCEATEDALQRRLDGGGGLDEAARAHLDACAACQGFARGLALLEDTMSAMTTDTLNQLPLTAIRERVARVGRAQRRAIPLIAAGLLVTLPLVAAVGGSDARGAAAVTRAQAVRASARRACFLCPIG